MMNKVVVYYFAFSLVVKPKMERIDRVSWNMVDVTSQPMASIASEAIISMMSVKCKP